MAQHNSGDASGPEVVNERAAAAGKNRGRVPLVPDRGRKIPNVDLGAANRIRPGHHEGDVHAELPGLWGMRAAICLGRGAGDAPQASHPEAREQELYQPLVAL